jgi:hypothetical protein
MGAGVTGKRDQSLDGPTLNVIGGTDCLPCRVT